MYFNSLAILLPKLAGKQAFYFFCIPFKAKLNAKKQEYLTNSNTKTLTVDDKNLATYSWGTGSKTILLVHGWQSHSYRWKNYIEKIDKKTYRVVAFDAPGHGNSEGLYSNVPLYEKALQEVVKEYGVPSTIIGHSIGAFSSMYFLQKNNLNIDRFISLATPFSANEFVKFFRAELKLSERAIKNMKAYFTQYVGKRPEDFSITAFGKSIVTPSLLIHDKEDTSTPFTNSQTLSEVLKGSELIITEGFGHKLKSREVIEKVIEFV